MEATISTQDQTSNDELLRAAMSGDMNAFTELFVGYRKELCSFVHAITGSSDDVEDIIQDIYIPVYNAIQGKDPSGFNLRAYLYKAARHEALRAAERKEKEEPTDEDDLKNALARADAAKLSEMADELAAELFRGSRNEKIKAALEDGDSEDLDKLRDEVRRSMRETKRPDSEDKKDG